MRQAGRRGPWGFVEAVAEAAHCKGHLRAGSRVVAALGKVFDQDGADPYRRMGDGNLPRPLAVRSSLVCKVDGSAVVNIQIQVTSKHEGAERLCEVSSPLEIRVRSGHTNAIV